MGQTKTQFVGEEVEEKKGKKTKKSDVVSMPEVASGTKSKNKVAKIRGKKYQTAKKTIDIQSSTKTSLGRRQISRNCGRRHPKGLSFLRFP